ncbi:MAG: glycosyltransferase family 87 protein [Chloroflexota bacterium]|jgi:hypothetical protein
MFAALNNRLKSASAKYGPFVGLSVILLLAVLAPLFNHNSDYLAYFRPATLTGDYGASHYSYNPYPFYWFIWPFAILPATLGAILWNLTNAAGFIFALRYWKSDLLAFSLSLPCFWILYSGQLEGIIAAAVIMALIGNPLVAGLGLTLLTFKPQLGLAAILFVLLRRRDWRPLILPAAVYLLSFIAWGWWIPDWLADIIGKGSTASVAMTNVSLFPYALLLLLLLWVYRSSLKIWLLVQSLAMPYFPVYSLAPYFTIQPPAAWLSILIWLLYLSAIWIRFPISPGFIIPLILLAQALSAARRERLTIVS